MAGSIKPRQYESKMTILIQESAKHNPFLEDFAVETRVKDRIAALKALLHSRHILVAVASDLELIDENTPAPERDRRIENLSRSLSVRLIGEELVELRYRQNTIARIDEVLIAVAQRFVEKVLAPERSSISGSQQFLQEQITGSAEALLAAENALARFMSENAANLPDLHAGNMRRLADMKLALSEKRTALEGAQARYQSLIARLAQNNPVVAQIERQIVENSADLATLKSRYTDRHSAVQAAERKLTRLKAERDSVLANAPNLTEEEVEELWAAAAQIAEPDSGAQILLVSQLERLQTSKAELVDLSRQVETLDKEITSLDRMVLNFGDIETRLRRLQSEVDVKQEVHESLKERAELARVTGALGQFEAPERVKVIDRPSIPTKPLGLPPAIYALLGLAAGIAIGIGLIVITEVTENTVRTRQHLADLTGVPVLARVPHLPSVIPDITPQKKRLSRIWRLRKSNHQEA
ncbi:MAG: hypothetical protein NXI16_16575 [Alphaproteobacteria bacterium]|nr:hypothetical protein [Alphaproteobacteria bacterium]